MAKLTLDQKLVQIYKAIDFIGKGGHNQSQSYDYVRAADVVRSVRAAFADHGIYAEIDFDFVGAPYTIARSKDKDAPFSVVNVKCSITLHDVDSDITRKSSGLGTGADLGDKAVYKAQTGSLKYALRHACLTPDEAGADPEADESVDRAAAEPATSQPKARSERVKSSRPDPVEALAEKPEAELPQSVIPPFNGDAEARAVVEQESGNEPTEEAPTTEDDGTLPTEEEIHTYRTRYHAVLDNLTTKGKLGSNGLKVDKKFLNFLLQTTGASRVGDVTRAQWDDFLGRAEAMGALDGGWVILAKKVNAANGIESTKKK